jgi:hypothetical protein
MHASELSVKERPSDPAGADGPPSQREQVVVHVSYVRAEKPIVRRFNLEERLLAVLTWALTEFGLQPTADQRFYLVNTRTDRPYSAEQEQQSLAALGFEHQEKLRIAVEHLAGS